MNTLTVYNPETHGNDPTYYGYYVEAINAGEPNHRALRYCWVPRWISKAAKTRRASHKKDAYLALVQICGETCANPRCGNVLDYSLGLNIQNKKKHPDNTPSLDHIVPKKIAKFLGWTAKQIDCIENYQILCYRCNRAKSDMFGSLDAERLRGLADMIDVVIMLLKNNNLIPRI